MKAGIITERLSISREIDSVNDERDPGMLDVKIVQLFTSDTEEEFNAVVLNLLADGGQIQTQDFVEGRTKEILTLVILHVLIHSRTKSVTQNIKGFI